MFRRTLSWAGIPALALAALLLTVGMSDAKGERGGGNSGLRGAYYGHSEGSYRGYNPGGNWGYNSSFYGRSYYRPSYYGYYGFPGYDWNYYPGYSDTYTYTRPVPSADYYSLYPPDTSRQSTLSTQDTNTARLRVEVPANAELLFDGDKTSQTGAVREFVTPPLTPGHEFNYDITARWRGDNGREVNWSKQVAVHAGDRITVDMKTPPRACEAIEETPSPLPSGKIVGPASTTIETPDRSGNETPDRSRIETPTPSRTPVP